MVPPGKGYHGAGAHVSTPYKGQNKPESQKPPIAPTPSYAAPASAPTPSSNPRRILRKLRCPREAGQLAKAIHVLQTRETGG